MVCLCPKYLQLRKIYEEAKDRHSELRAMLENSSTLTPRDYGKLLLQIERDVVVLDLAEMAWLNTWFHTRTAVVSQTSSLVATSRRRQPDPDQGPDCCRSVQNNAPHHRNTSGQCESSTETWSAANTSSSSGLIEKQPISTAAFGITSKALEGNCPSRTTSNVWPRLKQPV